MAISMTEKQRREFDDKGYIILEEFLSQDEVDYLLHAVDEVGERIRKLEGIAPADPFSVRNVLAHHEAFLDLVDHPRMLPLVVDAIGWNIQIRTSHLDYRPPYPDGLNSGLVGSGKGDDNRFYNNLGWHPDLSGNHMFEAASLDGRLPFMEIKVFYSLSDLTGSDHGNLWVVPGSYKRSPQELQDMNQHVPASQAIELRTAPGTAILWRTATWHCVGPNLSDRTRIIMHMGYHYRWLRPTDYMQQEQELIAQSDPVRRQLLGALASGDDPMGAAPEFHPTSRYWLTENPDDVPLKGWAEEQVRKKEACR